MPVEREELGLYSDSSLVEAREKAVGMRTCAAGVPREFVRDRSANGIPPSPVIPCEK